MQRIVNQSLAMGQRALTRGRLVVLPAYCDGQMHWPAVFFYCLGPLVVAWRYAYRPTGQRYKQRKLFVNHAAAVAWGTEI